MQVSMNVTAITGGSGNVNAQASQIWPPTTAITNQTVGGNLPSALSTAIATVGAGTLTAAGIAAHLIGGADQATELDAKRAIDQACRLAARL